MYLGISALTCVVLYPVMVVLKKAFEPGRNFALSASPIPSEFGLEHFDGLLTATSSSGDLLFLRYAANSAIVALATTALGLVLACTAAYALSRFRFAGRRFGLATFLAVQMFPGTLLLMPLYVILHELGLLNRLLGLVLVYATTAIPFCVWTLKGYFDSLPKDHVATGKAGSGRHGAVLVHDRLERVHPGFDLSNRRQCVHASGLAEEFRGPVLGRLGPICRWRHSYQLACHGTLLLPPALPGRRTDGWRRQGLDHEVNFAQIG
jgi:hypothetical protein